MAEHRFNHWGIAGALMLASCGAVFAELTWLRVLFASFIFWLGVLFMVRAGKPSWFLFPAYEDKRINSSFVVEVVQVPAKPRWLSWIFALLVIISISSGAAYLHYRVFGGQKTSGPLMVLVPSPAQPPAEPTRSTENPREATKPPAPVRNPPGPQSSPHRTSPPAQIIVQQPSFGDLSTRARKLADHLEDLAKNCESFFARAGVPDRRPPVLCTHRFLHFYWGNTVHIRDEFANFNFRDDDLDGDLRILKLQFGETLDMTPQNQDEIVNFASLVEMAQHLRGLADEVDQASGRREK